MSYLNKTCFSLLIFFFFNSAFSQKIIVIDSESGKSISNVTVFGKKSMKSMISGKNGNLELDIFSSNDTLVFGHLSYDNLITQKKSVKGSVVSLNPAAQALKEVILSVARSRESKEKISKKVSVLSSVDVELNVPQTSADLLKGSEVDFVKELIGEQFKISNPQSKSSCGCGVSFSL